MDDICQRFFSPAIHSLVVCFLRCAVINLKNQIHWWILSWFVVVMVYLSASSLAVLIFMISFEWTRIQNLWPRKLERKNTVLLQRKNSWRSHQNLLGFIQKKKKSFHNSLELYRLFIQMLWMMLITECIKTKGLSDSPWWTTQVNYSALRVQVWWFWVRLSDSCIFILMCTSKAKHLNRFAFNLEEKE